MNKFINISPWILLIIFYGSYGLEDGYYELENVQINDFNKPNIPNQQISSAAVPQLKKKGDDYWIMYKDEEYSDQYIAFIVTKILAMIRTVVFFETENFEKRLILHFSAIDIAQKFCKRHESKVALYWENTRTFNLLAVLETDAYGNPKEVVSKGQIWVNQFKEFNDCFRFTIIELDNYYLPYYIFDSFNFNVSEIRNKSYLFLTVEVSKDKYSFVLKFDKPDKAEKTDEAAEASEAVEPVEADEATNFRRLVTDNIVNSIKIKIPRNMVQLFDY